MTEYIYGDILFIINFSMDFVSLFICGKLMRFRMNALRMALASTIGGVYGVASLFIGAGALGTVLLDSLVALSLCFVAHYHGSIGRTVFVTGIFGAVSMFIGGAMTALYSKIGKYQYYVSIGGSVSTVFGEIPLWLFALLAAISAFITFFWQKAMQRKNSAKTCRIRLTLDGERYELDAFVDSGNCAEEPITGKAVVFISLESASAIKGESARLLFCSAENVDAMEAMRIRFIPVNTVSGYSLIAAIAPQKFEIELGGAFEEREALVACDINAKDYGGAGALVPSSLV